MKICGIVTNKKEADDIQEIGKTAVVGFRARHLGHYALIEQKEDIMTGEQ